MDVITGRGVFVRKDKVVLTDEELNVLVRNKEEFERIKKQWSEEKDQAVQEIKIKSWQTIHNGIRGEMRVLTSEWTGWAEEQKTSIEKTNKEIQQLLQSMREKNQQAKIIRDKINSLKDEIQALVKEEREKQLQQEIEFENRIAEGIENELQNIKSRLNKKQPKNYKPKTKDEDESEDDDEAGDVF